MTFSLPVSVMMTLLLLAAGGYALATVGMKLASGSISIIAVMLIILGMTGATVAEVYLLRGADLPVIYLAIVTCETLLVLIYATYIGETLSLSQVSGGALVLSGFALVTMSG
ncbi:5-aminolevulinate synthase [bacterium]|nr:5-aminolevulinate synthase [bacterium]